VTAGDLVTQARWLDGVIDELEPDLIQAHWLPRWGYLAACCGHPRVAVTAWGSDVYLAAGDERRRADEALLAARYVIARSDHMREEMVGRGVAPQAIWRVDLGVDLDRFRPPEAGEQRRLRERLGLPGGPVVLSPRAGTELYNLDVVLEALARVHDRRPDATLLLTVGDAPLSKRTRAALRRAAGVHTRSRIPHAAMPDYVRAATVGVSIPSSDGSPSSVWEALAAGLPMILSELPQIAEKVGNSEAVRLVAPVPGAVAGALSTLLDDPQRCRRASLAARAWALQTADEREEIARLGDLYTVMLQRPTPGREQSVPEPRSAPGTSTAVARVLRPS
jgi:glycosyltransferase involved in cell wall biosynthesis